MSLDLYIESRTPVIHRGTGVYIRENGETKELETKEEVLKHFPDVNPDEIEEHTYEDNVYFHINLTHNLTKMAMECYPLPNTGSGLSYILCYNLYQLLWHPEQIGIINPSEEYKDNVAQCYKKLLEESDFFKQFNPDNGWGTYEQLLEGTRKYLNALDGISDAYEDYVIVADT